MKKIIYILAKKLSIITVILLFSNIMFACSNSQKDQPQEVEIYKNNDLGWEMPIASGWEKMSDEKINRMINRGKSALEKSTDTEVENIDATKHLLSLEKGLNNFISNITKQTEEEFQENLDILKEVMYKTYLDNGFNVEVIENPDVDIDGVKFKNVTYKLSFDDKKFEQNYYFAYHRGYFFNVAWTTYEDAAKKEIENAFKASKFLK